MSRFYLKDGSEVPDLKAARKSDAVPSVTTVINGCSPHSFKYLEDRRLKQVIEDDSLSNDEKWDILGNSAIFSDGTVVHEAGELFLETGVRSDPLGLPYSSAQYFSLLSRFKPIKIEEFFRSKKYNTGGRVDLVCSFKDKLTLVDYKTIGHMVKTPKKTWIIQMAIYKDMLAEANIPIQKVFILQYSKKNEGCTLLEVSEEELTLGLALFKTARELYGQWIGI